MKIFLNSLIGLIITSASVYAEVSPEVNEVRVEWAKIKYQMPQEQRVEALQKLAAQAHVISQNASNQAEPLIWEAIVLSTLAGEDGGLGALSKVKQAKSLLEQAEKIDPASMDGSVYTSLGSLYYKVPGWPLGFGNDDKAKEYLLKALAINPDGIDANYFYGDYLLEQGQYQEALMVFEKALRAPERQDRPIADAGRRGEITQAISRAKQYL